MRYSTLSDGDFDKHRHSSESVHPQRVWLSKLEHLEVSRIDFTKPNA